MFKSVKLLSLAALGTVALLPSASAYADEAKPVGANYQSNGAIEFVPNLDPTDPVDPNNPDPNEPVEPVDPTNPDEKPEPGTNGPLSIDFASSLNFGLNQISNKDMTYYANAQEIRGAAANGSNNYFVPNYVQISDNRGTNAGWTLTVKQEGQFKNEDTLNKELTGAQIKLVNPEVSSVSQTLAPKANEEITLDPNGSESLVMAAENGSGAGLWTDRWGIVEEVQEKDAEGKEITTQKTKAISLAVPGKTAKDAVKYSTKLTWKLTDVPGNNE